MSTETLKVVVQYTGIGGIALLVFLVLFRIIIRKKIFSRLTDKQSYRLLVIVSVLVFFVTIVGIGAWIWTNINPSTDRVAGEVPTAKGAISIYFNKEQFKQLLKDNVNQLVKELKNANSQEKEALEGKLDENRHKLNDLKISYENYLQVLSERIVQLESIRGQLPDDMLSQAEKDLTLKGDTQMADKLLAQVEKPSDLKLKVVRTYEDPKKKSNEFDNQPTEKHKEDREGNRNAAASLGIAHDVLGRYSKDIEEHNQELVNARKRGDRSDEVNHLNKLGTFYSSQGQYHIAIVHYNEALIIIRKIGDKQSESDILINMASAYQSLGKNTKDNYNSLAQYAKAIEYYDHALVVVRKMEDQQGESFILGRLAGVYYSIDQYSKAIEYYNRALVIARKRGDQQSEEDFLRHLAGLYHTIDQYFKAIEFYHLALAIARDNGDRKGEANYLGYLGTVYRSLDQQDKALEYFRQVLVIARNVGDQKDEGRALSAIGEIYDSLGQYERSVEYLYEALPFFREIGDRSSEGTILAALGKAYSSLGHIEKAKECYTQSLLIFEAFKSSYVKIIRKKLVKLEIESD